MAKKSSRKPAKPELRGLESGKNKKPALITRQGEKQMPKTDIEKFLAEEQERQVKKQDLIKQLLEERAEKLKEFDEQLKLLGYGQSIKNLEAPAASGDKRKREAVIGTPCGVCGFATKPYHDGRLKAHRDQGKTKKPFTASELADQGFEKVPTIEG